jgi:O-antigen/teichoic acid export membrane protein
MFKQLLKDSAIYGFADFFLKVIAFFTFPVFAHLLSVNDFGIMTFATVIAGFVGMFLSLGLNNAIQRFYFDPSFPPGKRPLLVSTGYIVLAVWATILTLFCILIAYIFRDFTLQKYQLPFSYLALALLTNIPILLLTYSNDTIRLHFKPVNFLVLSFCRNVSGVALAIFLMKYYHMGLLGYFVANLIGVAVFIPLGIYLTRKDCKWLFDFSIARKIIRFGYPFIFAGLAYWAFGSMDRWMLGEWSTMEQVGLYSIAFKIGSVLLFVSSAFGQAWAPVAIKIMNDNPGTYKVLYSKLFTYWFAFLLLVGTATAFFSNEFLRLLTPQSYWAAGDVCVWVTAGLVISGTTQLTAIGISISQKTKYLTYIAWLTAIVNFVLNFFLIPRFGALGSAMATTFTYFVLSGGYLFISQKVHPLTLQKNKLIALLCILLLTIPVSLYLNSFEWNLMVISIKLLWLAGLTSIFFIFRIIDIKPLKEMFLKRKYA